MPTEYHFEDLDLREEPAGKSSDTGMDSDVTGACSRPAGCHTQNTCTTAYC